MSVATPTRPKQFNRWRFADQAHFEAERCLYDWAHQNVDAKEAAFGAEELVATPVDSGLDAYDPADALCLELAGPSRHERDPNADIFDRYTGAFSR